MGSSTISNDYSYLAFLVALGKLPGAEALIGSAEVGAEITMAAIELAEAAEALAVIEAGIATTTEVIVGSLASPLIALFAAGDSSENPIRIGIERAGKSIEHIIDEMQKRAQLMAEMLAIEAQLLQLKSQPDLLGREFEILNLQEQLIVLSIELHSISASNSITSGALKMVASAEDASVPTSPPVSPDDSPDVEVLPPALVAACKTALKSDGMVLALRIAVNKHPAWKSLIVDTFIEVVRNRDMGTSPAVVYLAQWAEDTQWAPRIMPVLIEISDLWMAASHIRDLSKSSPEVFTPDDVVGIITAAVSMSRKNSLSKSYLAEAIEALIQSRPDLISRCDAEKALRALSAETPE